MREHTRPGCRWTLLASGTWGLACWCIGTNKGDGVPREGSQDRTGPRAFFATMQNVVGDQGARGVLEANAGRIRFVDIDDDAIHADVDTPDDLHGSRP